MPRIENDADETVRVVEMPENGIGVPDGIAQDFPVFKAGTPATFGAAARQGRPVV